MKVVSRLVLSLLVFGLLSMPTWAQSDKDKDRANKQSTHAEHKAGKSKASGDQGAGHISAADKRFMMKAAESGKAEVELAQLATQKAQSPEVKQFAQRMADDHSQANDQLKSLAQQKGVNLPDQPSRSDQRLKARLEKLSGEQFDKAYTQAMDRDHHKDVKLFEKEASNGKDADVKAFASKTLPTLQEHTKMADNLAPKEKQEAKAEKKAGKQQTSARKYKK